MKRPKRRRHGIPAQISGIAGVYHVASELSRRGVIALPTNRNVAAFDIVASDQSGLRQAVLQVKSIQTRQNFWLLGRHVPDYMRKSSKAFYIFVRFDKKQDRPECFIASAKDVAKQNDRYVKDWYKRHKKTTKPVSWVYCWWLPKGKEKNYLNRWDKLRLVQGK